MKSVKFSAPIEPVPFKRVNFNGKFRFNDVRYTNFKTLLAYFAKAAMRGQAPFTGAIKLTATVYRKFIPTALKFGDWDNHGKAISDALNEICYLDDKQIVEGHIFLRKGTPRIDIELEELP